MKVFGTSLSVLPCRLLFVALQAERKLTGIVNFTNPGAISHNEILELYQQYIDRNLTWQNFSVEEQAKVIVAPRSNNLLDTKRVGASFSSTLLASCQCLKFEAYILNPMSPVQIEKDCPEILPIKESLIRYVFEPNSKKVPVFHRILPSKG